VLGSELGGNGLELDSEQSRNGWSPYSGPLLCMTCTSPIRFNLFLCTITEKFGVSTLVFLCCFQLLEQENLHKPFDWPF
jgi:hypothetical protein